MPKERKTQGSQGPARLDDGRFVRRFVTAYHEERNLSRVAEMLSLSRSTAKTYVKLLRERGHDLPSLQRETVPADVFVRCWSKCDTVHDVCAELRAEGYALDYHQVKCRANKLRQAGHTVPPMRGKPDRRRTIPAGMHAWLSGEVRR